MNEEEIEDKPQVNFYKLDVSKPFSSFSGDKHTVKSCTLTDGVVVNINRRKIGASENEEVEIVYKFTDDKMRERTGFLTSVYNLDAELYIGQYIMVAFNENSSYVLKKFTLTAEDQAKLLAAESKRSSDDFEGLTGELLDIDTKKPIKSLEYNYCYLLLAVLLTVVLALYFIPVGIIFLPGLFDDRNIVPLIIGSLICFSIPVVLICFIVVLFYKYFKRKKRVDSILKARNFYTWGRVFYSEKTYNRDSKKKLLYCYVDKWGDRHTEVLNGIFVNAIAHPRETAIVYTSDGRSVALDSYTFVDDGEYDFDEEDNEEN